MGVTKSRMREIHKEVIEEKVLEYCYLKPSNNPGLHKLYTSLCERNRYHLAAWKFMQRTGSSAVFRAKVEHMPVDPVVRRDAGMVSWWFDYPHDPTGEYVLESKVGQPPVTIEAEDYVAHGEDDPPLGEDD